MHRNITLSAYVRRRSGVPLGASGSMRNMLIRSFGAGSFYLFWHYWNPIWGYYLSRYVMKPLSRVLPWWLAIIFTFAVSGGIHDLAVSLVKWRLTFYFTPWFVLMAAMVVILKKFNVTYANYHWIIRVWLNLIFIVTCLVSTILFESLFV